MASTKIAYASSSNLTVTNLHSIATSSNWTAGWTSGTIDNTSNLYLDYLVSVKITLGTSLTAGEVRVYVYAMLDDSNFNDLFSAGTEGTEGTATVHDSELLDGQSGLKFLGTMPTDTTNSQVYSLDPRSVAALYGGICPAKFAIFIAHNTGANLASSGNQVTYKGIYATSA